MNQSLEALLGIDIPLIQAPMAGVQGSALALAVSGSGALGSLPAAMLTPDQLRGELAVLAASGAPYNVNFFCHVPPVPDAERWSLEWIIDALKETLDMARIRGVDGGLVGELGQLLPAICLADATDDVTIRSKFSDTFARERRHRRQDRRLGQARQATSSVARRAPGSKANNPAADSEAAPALACAPSQNWRPAHLRWLP